MCFVAAIGDRRTNDKLQRQKLLLDAALTNMSQGLCMFDAGGGIILFNDRYAQLTRMSAASLEGRTLLDVVRTRNLPVSPEAFVAEVVKAMRQRQYQHARHRDGGRAHASRHREAETGRRLGVDVGRHNGVAESPSANRAHGPA
jgi:PAS domain S-box-containing protein